MTHFTQKYRLIARQFSGEYFPGAASHSLGNHADQKYVDNAILSSYIILFHIILRFGAFHDNDLAVSGTAPAAL